MAYFIFLFILAGFTAFGWWQGGLRLLLWFTPLLLASILIWLFAGILYRIDFLVGFGLVWPAAIPLVLGFIGGGFIRHYGKKKLPEDKHQYDRIGGAIFGVFLAIVVTWLGAVFFWMNAISNQNDASQATIGLARSLNGGVVRWIPGIGAGSSTMTEMIEIASASDEARERAVEKLGIADLMEHPDVRNVVDDPEIQATIESVGKLNIAALWRLQSDDRIIALFDVPEIQDAVKRISLSDINDAIEESEKEIQDEAER